MAISTTPRPALPAPGYYSWRETLIKVAAQRQGVNITDFIIRSACEKAEAMLLGQNRFVLNHGQWMRFVEALDRPPPAAQRLAMTASEVQT